MKDEGPQLEHKPEHIYAIADILLLLYGRANTNSDIPIYNYLVEITSARKEHNTTHCTILPTLAAYYALHIYYHNLQHTKHRTSSLLLDISLSKAILPLAFEDQMRTE
jgi:hypothetical protein